MPRGAKPASDVPRQHSPAQHGWSKPTGRVSAQRLSERAAALHLSARRFLFSEFTPRQTTTDATIFLFSFPSGLAGPAAHETLPFCGRVVGIEVGIRLVRLSPLFSWT